MDQLPTTALLESGYLRARCHEPAFLKCSECGLDFGPGDTCQSCFCAAIPLRTCRRCQQTFDASVPDGERACRSLSAFEQGQRPAFALEEGLWACKTELQGAVFILDESDLRCRLADGRLSASVLLRGPDDQEFAAASGRSEFPELQALALAEVERKRAARKHAEDAAERERRRLLAARLELEPLEAEAAAGGKRRGRPEALVARWGTAAALAAILATVWNLPIVQESHIRPGSAESAGGKSLATAARPLLPDDVSAGTAVAAAPPAPEGSALTPTPAFGGYVTDQSRVLPAGDATYLSARLERMAASGVKVHLVIVDTTGTESLQAFNLRVGNAWKGADESARSDLLISVAVKDRTIRVDPTRDVNAWLTDQEARALIDRHFQPAASKAGLPQGLRALAEQLDRVLWAHVYAVRGESEVQASTISAMAALARLMAGWDGQPGTLTHSEQASMDASIARLESVPRPARGDRKTARQLHSQGLAILGQTGFESLAVEKLTLAHLADPLDVQVVNDLAYAESVAGRYGESLVSLQKTLRLAPTRTSAWVNLAEALPLLLRPSDEASSVASLCYVLGYYFSRDRAKTMEYLRNKVDSNETKPEVRAVASEALRRIESYSRANASSTEGRATQPEQVTKARSPHEYAGRDKPNENAKALSGQIDDGDLDRLRRTTIIR